MSNLTIEQNAQIVVANLSNQKRKQPCPSIHDLQTINLFPKKQMSLCHFQKIFYGQGNAFRLPCQYPLNKNLCAWLYINEMYREEINVDCSSRPSKTFNPLSDITHVWEMEGYMDALQVCWKPKQRICLQQCILEHLSICDYNGQFKAMTMNELEAMLKINNQSKTSYLQICLELYCPDMNDGSDIKPPVNICINYAVCNPYYVECNELCPISGSCSDKCGDLIINEIKIKNAHDIAVYAKDLKHDNCLSKVDMGQTQWEYVDHLAALAAAAKLKTVSAIAKEIIDIYNESEIQWFTDPNNTTTPRDLYYNASPEKHESMFRVIWSVVMMLPTEILEQYDLYTSESSDQGGPITVYNISNMSNAIYGSLTDAEKLTTILENIQRLLLNEYNQILIDKLATTYLPKTLGTMMHILEIAYADASRPKEQKTIFADDGSGTIINTYTISFISLDVYSAGINIGNDLVASGTINTGKILPPDMCLLPICLSWSPCDADADMKSATPILIVMAKDKNGHISAVKVVSNPYWWSSAAVMEQIVTILDGKDICIKWKQLLSSGCNDCEGWNIQHSESVQAGNDGCICLARVECEDDNSSNSYSYSSSSCENDGPVVITLDNCYIQYLEQKKKSTEYVEMNMDYCIKCPSSRND